MGIDRIAERQIERIHDIVKNVDVIEPFANFVESLRSTINPAITEEQAIEMLSQHMLTQPVFEALFENYSFAEHNQVSKSMQVMVKILEENAPFTKDMEILKRFYTSVQETARGWIMRTHRQAVVLKLYDTFFQTAFPRMAQQLGIVYTPVELVDFMIRSVDDVHILDPFTGTGTFITRLLQSGLIKYCHHTTGEEAKFVRQSRDSLPRYWRLSQAREKT